MHMIQPVGLEPHPHLRSLLNPLMSTFKFSLVEVEYHKEHREIYQHEKAEEQEQCFYVLCLELHFMASTEENLGGRRADQKTFWEGAHIIL